MGYKIVTFQSILKLLFILAILFFLSSLLVPFILLFILLFALYSAFTFPKKKSTVLPKGTIEILPAEKPITPPKKDVEIEIDISSYEKK